VDKTDFQGREEKARESTGTLLEKIDKVCVGHAAGEVALACMERVLAIIQQPNCPVKFKQSVVYMMASAIVEVMKP
jgi:hypothetical protein